MSPNTNTAEVLLGFNFVALHLPFPMMLLFSATSKICVITHPVLFERENVELTLLAVTCYCVQVCVFVLCYEHSLSESLHAKSLFAHKHVGACQTEVFRVT